jgi:hypothetical protein
MIQGKDSVLRYRNLGFFTQKDKELKLNNKIAKFTKLASRVY